MKKNLFSFWSFLIFFGLFSFIVTCCFLLFLHTMQFDREQIRGSAIITFINVILLSLLCSLIDSLRRRLTVDRPVKRILEATRRLTAGDFTARIQPFHGPEVLNEFDAIIADFNKMAEELAGIETLRTDFFANVSHELKTPLAVIQNYATMLQAPGLPEDKRQEYAKAVTIAARRLADLITNILKLNKLENQQIYPDIREYNLSEQLCECLLQFEDVWEKKQLEIETDIQEDILITADPELLSLVWNNLFSNAMKFTGDGGRVTVILTSDREYASVTVSDTGCGIPPEVGAHIFEKFYQGDTSHASQGNGLGLALVKRVVDITGGQIDVQSTVGEGSSFTVQLQRRPL